MGGEGVLWGGGCAICEGVLCCRWCSALSSGSGTLMYTSSAMLPREPCLVESSSCSGTSATPPSSLLCWQVGGASYWHAPVLVLN